MSKSNHPIEQEELMAYLDGELATNRAVAAAAHLEHCAECQELAADLRKLSQEMMACEVEAVESSSEIPDEIVAALEKWKKEPKKQASIRRRWSMLFTPRKLVFAGGSAVVLVLILSFFSFSALRPVPMARFSREGAKLEGYYRSHGSMPKAVAPPPSPNAYADLDGSLNGNMAPGIVGQHVTRGREAESISEGDEINTSEREVPTVPMIARVAGITLTTKEFDKTRASLEEILKRHSGYLGDLKVNAPAESGRTLTATLRIPAPQLESALSEMKKLGRVEDESQGGEEVTQQYVDLEARLANGIHTEQRLTEILRTRTGKLQDVLKVELEIDRVRGEIEQMQAEKKELSKRVAFATLNTTVKEEYFAKLQGTPPSTRSRFRNAAVDGYNTVVEGVIDVGLFLLSAGPSLLLWVAILFFPARWGWKKLRYKFAEPEPPSAS
jgi:anti-sigma factor RsiW